MSKVNVRVREIPVPESLLGRDYEEDIEFRNELKSWIEKVWSEKDHYLEERR